MDGILERGVFSIGVQGVKIPRITVVLEHRPEGAGGGRPIEDNRGPDEEFLLGYNLYGHYLTSNI
jgi:hypothetical protein